MSDLNSLLRAAAEADPGVRIRYRDPIAAFGRAAIEKLESWLHDDRLDAFAVVTIERAAAQPGALQAARSTLARNHRASTERLIAGALARIGSQRGALRGSRAAKVAPASRWAAPGVVPDAVRLLVEAWVAAGRPPQPAEPWNRRLWRKWHPTYVSLLDALPVELDRASVRRFCGDATISEEAATRALLASLAWGYAHANYGPSRARTMLDSPRAGARVLRVARTLAEQGAEDAYALLADTGACHLDKLGVSYATKFLYFVQPDGLEPVALIHDDLVSGWLLDHTGISLPCNRWSVGVYGDYLRLLRSWAAELGCAADEVECCIFQAEATKRNNPWA